MNMKKTIVFEFVVGSLLLVSALYTYIPQVQYMYELTFRQPLKTPMKKREKVI